MFFITIFVEYNYITTLVCSVFGVGAVLWQQRYQERQKQFWAIQSVLASFENTRITLLVFKGQFIDTGEKELAPFLKDGKIDSNNLPDQLEKWKNLVSKENTILKFFEKQNFYPSSYAEKLAFVAERNPENLIFIHKAYETLQQLNNMIEIRNQELIKYRTSSEGEGGKITKYLAVYCEILPGLKGLTDDSLAFHDNSSKCLIAYAEANYCVRNARIFRKRGKTNYERLMPEKDLLKAWDEAFK